jgi:hypothetical protein
MNKSNFSVTSSYLTNPTTTRIAIQSKDGSTWLTRDVPGDHTSKTDEAKIQLILDILATELDPAGALARYQAKSENCQRVHPQCGNESEYPVRHNLQAILGIVASR